MTIALRGAGATARAEVLFRHRDPTVRVDVMSTMNDDVEVSPR